MPAPPPSLSNTSDVLAIMVVDDLCLRLSLLFSMRCVGAFFFSLDNVIRFSVVFSHFQLVVWYVFTFIRCIRMHTFSFAPPFTPNPEPTLPPTAKVSFADA